MNLSLIVKFIKDNTSRLNLSGFVCFFSSWKMLIEPFLIKSRNSDTTMRPRFPITSSLMEKETSGDMQCIGHWCIIIFSRSAENHIMLQIKSSAHSFAVRQSNRYISCKLECSILIVGKRMFSVLNFCNHQHMISILIFILQKILIFKKLFPLIWKDLF